MEGDATTAACNALLLRREPFFSECTNAAWLETRGSPKQRWYQISVPNSKRELPIHHLQDPKFLAVEQRFSNMITRRAHASVVELHQEPQPTPLDSGNVIRTWRLQCKAQHTGAPIPVSPDEDPSLGSDMIQFLWDQRASSGLQGASFAPRLLGKLVFVFVFSFILIGNLILVFLLFF